MSAATQNASPTSRRRAPRRGRPTEDEAQRRIETLLDRAFEMFCEKGFDQTTIESVAASLRMTKRTVYARFADKGALFKAAVGRATDRLAQPRAVWAGLTTDDLEETLIRFARARIRHLSTPDMLRLQRIVGAESYRFPEIFAAAYEAGTKPLVECLTGVLRRHAAQGAVRATRYDLAALAFMSLVVGGPARLAAAGSPLSEREIETRVAFNVALFLRGVATSENKRKRQASAAPAPRERRLQ